MMEGRSAIQEKVVELTGQHRLPSWREMNWDTTPETETILFKLWRETPGWRKIEMMEGMNQTGRQLALMGLRKRFPDANTEELKRRLAGILLGEELATIVYGSVSN